MALGHWLKDYIGPHSGGSGGGTELVVANFTKTSETAFTSDKTFAELNEARQNGKLVMAVLSDSSTGIDIYLYLAQFQPETKYIKGFMQFDYDSKLYSFDSDNVGVITLLDY